MKVIIADDHPLIAEGIKANFKDEPSIDVVFMAKNGKEVLEYINKHEVDLVLMDIEMPEMNGIECSKKIRKEFPAIDIIVLSMYEEASLAESFIEFGIKGYLLKTASKEEVLEAIKAVQKGQTYFSEEVMNNIKNDASSKVSVIPSFQSSASANRLSQREIEVIALISKGYTNAQIADNLFISTRTAETHRKNILKKTKTTNMASLIRFAFQNGII